MIGNITIKNYKSVQDLELSMGRITVLIGANGCGKSNILEAIALCSAAVDDKLDHEFLVSRGIRVPDDPRFMRSAFEVQHTDANIEISTAAYPLGGDRNADEVSAQFDCILTNTENTPYSVWSNIAPKLIGTVSDMRSYLQNLEGETKTDPSFNVTWEMIKPLFEKHIRPLNLQGFLIYSPENSSLRTFESEGQIQPLGIKGEGLFKLLTVLSTEKNTERLAEIKKKLMLLDWFDDFEIISGLSTGERNINIRDKYLDESLSYFTQKSANEGFLFLLFYFTLFISRETPSFFAIDNINASLNPKLCSRLLKELAELAKAHDKQAVVTTHNPAVLDGLNLNDDEQRLFVIYRNKLGHTRAKRILKQEIVEGQASVPLSEAFLRGYLGGLPKNF